MPATLPVTLAPECLEERRSGRLENDGWKRGPSRRRPGKGLGREGLLVEIRRGRGRPADSYTPPGMLAALGKEGGRAAKSARVTSRRRASSGEQNRPQKPNALQGGQSAARRLPGGGLKGTAETVGTRRTRPVGRSCVPPKPQPHLPPGANGLHGPGLRRSGGQSLRRGRRNGGPARLPAATVYMGDGLTQTATAGSRRRSRRRGCATAGSGV